MKTYQTRPCAECPWRTDVAPGRFPPERFRDLAETAYDLSQVQFACHKSRVGKEFGCAGFALRGAAHNLGVRLAARAGRLRFEAIDSPTRCTTAIGRWRSPTASTPTTRRSPPAGIRTEGPT